MGEQFTATDYTDDKFYQEHVDAGINYLICGNWQRSYALMVTRATLQDSYPSPAMLDGGCACGALVNAFDETGVYDLVLGIDASPAMIALGREKFALGERIMAGSLSDLRVLSDDVLTLISTSQVLEHIGDESVDGMMAEFFRVLAPGGRMFHHYDALKPGDAPDAYAFDPTHVNVKPQRYWMQKFVAAGFLPDFESFERFMRSAETTGGNGVGQTFHDRYRQWSVSTWIKP